MEKNKEIEVREILGFTPNFRVQISPFDSEIGEITKVKVENGKILFYVNFYGGGWKCFENLLDEAKHSAKIIADEMHYSVK